jgi:hypothetical protein
MSDNSTGRHHDAERYEIRLRGHLDSRWAAWFDGLSLTTDNDGTTVVSGPVADQAALHGLLQKVRDVGLPLVSVVQVRPDPSDVTTVAARTLTDSQQSTQGETT